MTTQQRWLQTCIILMLFAAPVVASAQTSNLIANPSFDSANGATPANWTNTSWGSPKPTFKYPDTGRTGGSDKAASITYTKNSSGDARWAHDPVAVTPGTTYQYSSWYKSNAATEIDIQYISASGAISWGWVADVPSSNNAWKQITATITVPSGTAKIVVFHLIDKKGTLTVDDVSLSTGSAPPPPPPDAPTVSLTASPSSIASGQQSTLSWSATNAASCTASDGWSGTKTLSGTQAVSPTTSTTYTLSCSGEGGNASQSATVTVTSAPPPPSGGFTEGMVSLTFDDSWTTQYTNALPMLQASGFKGTFYLTTEPVQEGWDDFMTPNQIKDIAQKGHEIAGHTVTHADLTTLNQSRINTEIKNSKTYLQNLTGQTVVSLAYPYGSYNNTVKTLVKNAGYSNARGVEYDTHNTATTDTYALQSQCIETSDSMASIKARIDSAKTNKEWYILCFHEIKTNGDQWSTTPARLQEIIDYIKASGIKVVTVKEGRGLMAN